MPPPPALYLSFWATNWGEGTIEGGVGRIGESKKIPTEKTIKKFFGGFVAKEKIPPEEGGFNTWGACYSILYVLVHKEKKMRSKPCSSHKKQGHIYRISVLGSLFLV